MESISHLGSVLAVDVVAAGSCESRPDLKEPRKCRAKVSKSRAASADAVSLDWIPSGSGALDYLSGGGGAEGPGGADLQVSVLWL